MKSTLKFALVIVAFAFVTACGGKKPETTTADSVKTVTPETAPVTTTTPDTTATGTADSTKK